MKNFSIILSTIAVILSAIAIVKTSKAPVSGTETSFSEQQVADALKNKPQMIIDAMQAYQIQQREAEEKAAQEALERHLDDINSHEYAPFIGPKDAKVTVVEFFDFSCGYCRHLAPVMEKIVADNADVKFVFKPVSFVSPNSGYQAKAALAADNQGKFAEFYKALFGAQGPMNKEKVDETAKSIGLDMVKFKADVEDAAISEKLDKITSLIQKIRVNGVPTVLVNGKHVQSMQAEEFQKAIDSEK